MRNRIPENEDFSRTTVVQSPELGESIKRNNTKTRWLGFALASFTVLWVAGFVFRFSGYLMDDAFIGFQFARNLAEGNGFVFFHGCQPVEGVTNVAWLLLMLPWATSESLPAVAQYLGAVFSVLSVWCVLLIRRYLLSESDCEWLNTFAPALLLMFSADFLYFSSSGMETGFASFVLLLPALLLRSVHTMTCTLGLFSAMITLIRPEMILVYPGYLLLQRISPASDEVELGRLRLLAGVGVWGAVILFFVAMRMFWFGMPLPNTFYSKPGSMIVLLGNCIMSLLGSHANLGFPFNLSLVFLAPMLLVGWRQIRMRQPKAVDWLMAVTCSGVLFSLSAPLDWTRTGRYFAPYLGAGLVILWEGVVVVARATLQAFDRPQLLRPCLLLILELLLVANVCDFGIRFSEERLAQYPGYVMVSRSLISAARWISENTAADAVIATRRIGVLGYFSGRRVFDYYYGLTEPEVSGLVHRRGKLPDGPQDPDLKNIWSKIKPDYLLEDESEMLAIARACNGTLDRLEIHGLLYRIRHRFCLGSQDWILMQRFTQ